MSSVPDSPPPYVPRRPATSRTIDLRGLAHHVLEWGEPAPGRPPLVMLHGWMDVAASFQFVVDAFAADRHVLALDWRGFGLSATPAADTYFFHEYLGDLDALLRHVSPEAPVDLAGHSMGGNVAMLYSGVRPGRVRRLVNLEGFGMPRSDAEAAPARITRWLDSLREAPELRPYADLAAVAARLRKTNPLLRPDRAAWLAERWSMPAAPDSAERRLLADPNHKRDSPQRPNVDEWMACWRRIAAPVLWIEGDRTDLAVWWGDRYGKPEFHRRLDEVASPVERHVVSPAGHMLHHDQPEPVAHLIERFLDGPPPVPRPAGHAGR